VSKEISNELSASSLPPSSISHRMAWHQDLGRDEGGRAQRQVASKTVSICIVAGRGVKTEAVRPWCLTRMTTRVSDYWYEPYGYTTETGVTQVFPRGPHVTTGFVRGGGPRLGGGPPRAGIGARGVIAGTELCDLLSGFLGAPFEQVVIKKSVPEAEWSCHWTNAQYLAAHIGGRYCRRCRACVHIERVATQPVEA